MGVETSNPYERAFAANAGFLPMNQTEAIYFKTSTANGKPLDARCAYDVRVAPQPSRWWSLTIYRAEGGLPANRERAWSIDQTRGVAGPDGGVTIRVAPAREGATNWISTERAGAFSLWLRLYNPSGSASAGATMPMIVEHGCGK